MQNIDQLEAILKQSGEPLTPLTVAELDSIRQLAIWPLPAAYEAFLLRMGKGAGKFMQGSSVFYPELLELNAWGKELVLENQLEPLPENSFVFWMHQGYQMAYFILGESDNPTIHYFSEGKGQKTFLQKEPLLSFLGQQLKLSGILKDF